MATNTNKTNTFEKFLVLDNNKIKWSMMLSMAQQVKSGYELSLKQHNWLKTNFKGDFKEFQKCAENVHFEKFLTDQLGIKDPSTEKNDPTVLTPNSLNSTTVVSSNSYKAILKHLEEKAVCISLTYDGPDGINVSYKAVPLHEIEKILYELEKTNDQPF